MKLVGLYYKLLDSFLISLPVPLSINYFWGVGSMLGLCIVVQVLSGFILSLFYSCSVDMAFVSVVSIMMDVNGGWIVRYTHSSGASVLMFLVYVHVFRGLWYGSYKLFAVWVVGVMIVMVVSLVSFLGYVLPWGQMSFWAATVITSMVTVVPYVGSSVATWLWGSFTMGESTLVRFFSFHYIISLFLLVLIVVHIVNLHEVGSSNPVGGSSALDKLTFHPLFTYKDTLGLFFLIWLYVVAVLVDPLVSMDSVNFEECSLLNTPAHIKPEWYFLYAYCVLRSISSKLGGVVMMLMSMIVLLVPCVSKQVIMSMPSGGYLMSYIAIVVVWSFVGLTLIGGCVVEYPFDVLGKVFTFMYFLSVLMIAMLGAWSW